MPCLQFETALSMRSCNQPPPRVDRGETTIGRLREATAATDKVRETPGTKDKASETRG